MINSLFSSFVLLVSPPSYKVLQSWGDGASLESGFYHVTKEKTRLVSEWSCHSFGCVAGCVMVGREKREKYSPQSGGREYE